MTTNHDHATNKEQRQELEEGQASTQARAKKPRIKAPTTAAEKAIEDGNQERHEQSQTSNGNNTTTPKPRLDAHLERYTLKD